MIMIQKEVEMSVLMTLTMLALYNPSQVLLRQRHRQPSIMRQRKPRRPSNATSVMNVHSNNTCLWRSPDNILLRLLELIQVSTWMSSRRQSVVARTHTYHQSSLPHELQAMDCIVKVVVIDRFSCMTVFFKINLTFEMSMCVGSSIHFWLTNGCFCESVNLERKCLDLRGTRTPNLRIHAECSNHLSYQGQTFAVPCIWILPLAI